MPVQQLTIFLENQAGRLAEVARILKDGNINLQGFSTTEARDYGILRLVVSDTEKARQKLKDAGFTTHVAEVICFSVEDRPGELSRILDILANEKLNIDYIYVIAGTRLIISVDDVKRAESVLKDNSISLC
ncbi:MAG: ACT domain-containing protein [Actinobacteria bacterium]|nr:ACT domain-containing protein [Actinomycetota bacterium]